MLQMHPIERDMVVRFFYFLKSPMAPRAGNVAVVRV